MDFGTSVTNGPAAGLTPAGPRIPRRPARRVELDAPVDRHLHVGRDRGADAGKPPVQQFDRGTVGRCRRRGHMDRSGRAVLQYAVRQRGHRWHESSGDGIHRRARDVLVESDRSVRVAKRTAHRRRPPSPGRDVPLVPRQERPQRAAQGHWTWAIAPRPAPSSRSSSRTIATARSCTSTGYLRTAATRFILPRTNGLQQTRCGPPGLSAGREG